MSDIYSSLNESRISTLKSLRRSIEQEQERLTQQQIILSQAKNIIKNKNKNNDQINLQNENDNKSTSNQSNSNLLVPFSISQAELVASAVTAAEGARKAAEIAQKKGIDIQQLRKYTNTNMTTTN